MKARTIATGALLVGGGLALSHVAGSRAEPGAEGGPLPSVGAAPNAFASAPLRLEAAPDVVREHALIALQDDLPPLLGAAESIEATPLGLDAVVRIKQDNDCPVIFITGYPDRVLQGDEVEPDFVISKPYTTDNVRAAVVHCLDARRA